MNTLTIPPSPNWYETNISACAPDNTLIYGARTDIVILENCDSNQVANVRIISRAHSQKIICINVNKHWGQPRKLSVSLSDDKIVKVWNIESGKKVYSHNKHLPHDKVIGATFAGEERIISVSEDGTIVIWNLGLNETSTIKELLGIKVSVTCLSTCPHATWLTAFGLKNGLVIVADLRKNGKILYKMRGHDKSVISLSWCPVPINVFPKNPHNFVGQKKLENESKEEVPVNEPKTESIIDFEVCHPLLKMYGYNEDDGKYLQKYLLKQCDIVDHNKLDLASGSQIEKNVSSNETSEERRDTNTVIETNSENSQNLQKTLNTDKKCNTFENIDNSSETIKVPESTNNSEKLLKSTSEAKEENASVTDKSELNDHICEDEKHAELIHFETCEDVGREINTKPVAEEEEPRKEFLLASSAKEGNIYIWRAGTDGRMQTFLTVPNKPGNRKFKSPVDKIWITLCWVSPTILLSSSKSSELIAWTLPKPQDNPKAFTVMHKDHSSLLFSISAPSLILNEYNWKETTEMNAWTTSQDRLLLNTKISSERTNLACYPTFGASIQCMQSSPLDPNRLAIGTLDGFIRLWDLSRPHTKNITMSTFYQKIQSKVSAIAWHPVNELLLAFGTSEGRVGYMDTNNRSKMPVLLPQYFKSEVYKLEWAPINGDKTNLGLYAVGEGRLVLFDVKKTPKDPMEIEKPQNTFIYSLAWKPDYSFLLVTTKSGFLIVYSADMEIICKLYFQCRINDIVWHPNAAISGTRESNWFAAISNTKTVLVYDFDVESDNNDKNIINTFQGVSEIINGVVWSPYDPSHIAISCEIGVVQIWDVEKNEILSTFINHNFESVMSVIWSPSDPDIIISGGKDNTLRVWKISDHPPLDNKEVSSQKKKVSKEIAAEVTDLLPKIEPPLEETVKVKKPVKNVLFPNYYTPKNLIQVVSDLKKLLLWKENTSSVEIKIGDNCEVDILNIFGSDQAMMNLVSLNELIHRQKGRYSLNTTLSLFRGDISTSIKEAIEEKRVTLKIISLAPMVSPKLWQAACETYANQLLEEANSDPLEIATYYLACHKVEKAIHCLCEAFLFREALALAKCRMTGELIVNEIISKWGVYAVQTGNFEVAAQCNIFLGKYEEAASVLFRRTDLELLQFAMELAKKAGNTDLEKAVLFRYNAFKDSSDKTEQELHTKQEVFLNHDKTETEISNNLNELNKSVENDKEENNQILVDNHSEVSSNMKTAGQEFEEKFRSDSEIEVSNILDAYTEE